MDSNAGISLVSRRLLSRSTHRQVSNPALGSFSAFLTLLLFIRVAANFYIAMDLYHRGAALEIMQIAGAHFAFLAAYGIMIGALSGFRIGLSLPGVSFIDSSPGGKAFKRGFILRAAFLRPFNFFFLGIFCAAAVVFGFVSGDWLGISVRAIIMLCAVALGIVIVVAAASAVMPGRQDIQLMEIISLIVLVGLNPDIASIRGKIGVSFRGLNRNFGGIRELLFYAAAVIAAALASIAIVKLLSLAEKLFHGQSPSRPFSGWYRRFIRIKWWALLYALALPLLLSPRIPAATKKWILALSLLFGFGTYLYFLSSCDTTIREKWRWSIFDKGNIRYAVVTLPAHLLLTAVALAAYLISR